jgi:hypothetical protein
MIFFLNCLALFLCWVGSTAAYMASDQQLIVRKPLPKKWAWLLFLLCLLFALITLSFLHHWLAAFLILLSFVMTTWIALALIVPYFPKQCKTLFVGTVFTFIIAIIGGFYVV